MKGLKEVKEEINLEMLAKCSKCGHRGILYINDEDIKAEVLRNFWKVAALFSAARILLLMLASAVLGAALGYVIGQ